jgi:CyaY protein
MEDNEFFDLVEGIFNDIEDQIDELEFDIDIDVSGGLLSIVFPEGSSCVLSKQVANHEIWVAAKSGGFHLQHKDNNWVCSTTGENLSTLLSRVFTEQLGVEVSL